MLRGGRQPYLGFYVNDAISPLDVPLGQWVHLVFQYDGSHQQLWIDGQLLCSRAASAYDGSAGKTVIGRSPRWNNVPSKDFEGYMRELRIYGRALAPDEIASLFDQGNDTGVKAIVNRSHWRSPNEPYPETQAVEFGIPFLAIDGRKLVITGESRQVYEVLATEDLTGAWQPLVTLTNKSGIVQFSDTEAAGVPQRFYRIIVK
jgi:Concanavalin A-like lectin/glucanases superfamily